MVAAQRWRDSRRGDLLLAPGLRLAEAQLLRAAYGAELAPDLVAFVDKSSRKEDWRRRRGYLEQFAGADPALAERDLLADGVIAVSGCDERGALLGDQAAIDRSAGFHPFRGDHDVDVAGIRHQRHHRFLALRGVGARKELHVINGGARALRDAGHRCCLDEVAGSAGCQT